MHIPLVDLEPQFRQIETKALAAVQEVLRSGDFVLGEQVVRFEEEFGRYCGVEHCVGVGSGLDALHLALRAFEIGSGDEVITAAHTFIATALAVTHAGATPVLVDVREDDFLLDPELLEAAITPRTRAIIPVHLYGQPARMREILVVAQRHGLVVIEDACQAHGARYESARVGSLADAACFSFYPGKNLGGSGDGGAVVTRDAAVADRMRRLRNYGQSRKYIHDEIGFNSRLDSIQAALLRVKLSRLDEWNANRRMIVADYHTRLSATGLSVPGSRPEVEHVWHLFVLRHPARDRIVAEAASRGIFCGIHYPRPVHHHPPYAGVVTVPHGAPIATTVARDVFSIPLYPGMQSWQIGRVVESLATSLGR